MQGRPHLWPNDPHLHRHVDRPRQVVSVRGRRGDVVRVACSSIPYNLFYVEEENDSLLSFV